MTIRQLLLWALGLFVVMVVSAWLQRVGSDLSWDEAHSYRVYARNPLVAVGLYLEPNNHPLESLFRSLFVVLGLDRVHLRLPALVILAGYLSALVWLLRPWTRAGQWVPAGMLTVGLLLATGSQTQALQLRGYFPTMVLVLVYAGLLCRGLRDAREEPRPGRTLWVFAGLSALMLFTVPSNLLLLPSLWAGALIVYGARSGTGPLLRDGLRLAGRSALLTLVLYAPIGLGALLGINRFDQFPGGTPSGFWSGIREVLELGTPLGVPAVVFGVAAVGLLLLGAIVAPRSRQMSAAMGMAGLVILSAGAFNAFVNAPLRIKSPMIVILWFALSLATGVLTRRLPLQLRVVLGLVLVAVGFMRIPDALEANRPNRTLSDIVSLVEVTCPETDGLLIGVDTDNLAFYMVRAFGERHVIRKRIHVDETLTGTFRPTVPENTSWKEHLRRRFFPELETSGWNVADVRTLVLIREEDFHPEPGYWDHPVLTEIFSGMSVVGEYHRTPYHIVVGKR